MSIQYSEAVRHARLAADETTVGTSPVIELWSGTKPANCAAADATGDGAKLVTVATASDWQGTPSGGKVDKAAGTWSGTGLAAAGAGTNITHFRLKSSGGTVHMQGTVGVGSGELQVDNINVAEDQTVTVTKFERTAGNA